MLTDVLRADSSRIFINRFLSTLGVGYIRWEESSLRASYSIRAWHWDDSAYSLFYSDEEYLRTFEVSIYWNIRKINFCERNSEGYLRKYKTYSWEPGLIEFARWVRLGG